MIYRSATLHDSPLLAQLNFQLIQDEGHRNSMTVPQLEERMRVWLRSEYDAMLFEQEADILAYALYRRESSQVYLRQFFVVPQHRRQGVGRRAMSMLLNKIWPKDRRILVEVLCQNTAATAFWKSVGFQEYSLALEILPESR